MPGKHHNCLALLALSVILTSSCVKPTENERGVTATQTKPEQPNVATGVNKTASLQVNVVNVDKARNSNLVKQVLSGVNELYQRCRIAVQFNNTDTTLAPENSVNSKTRLKLAEKYKNESPTVFFVSHTTEADVAFAYLPSLNTQSASTIWITDRVNERCLTWITAHELGHVLLNNGKHHNGTTNVMSNGCTLNNWNNAAAPIFCIKLDI